MNLKKVPFQKIAVLLLFLSLGVSKKVIAQTTLTAGNIAFTGYNSSSYGNSFSFVLLANISSGTSINFTDIGWNPVTSSLSSIGTDGVFTWTSSSAMSQFTEVTIIIGSAGTSITSVSSGSASSPTGGTGSGTGMILSGSGDQIVAYQGAQASPTFIAAIHCNQEVVNGTSAASTLTSWDDIQASGGWPYNANRSAIPPGLTNGTNAVMVVTGTAAGAYTEYDADKYNCTGSSNGTSVAAVRTAINDRSNWTVNNSGVTLPSGCTFSVAATPVITGQPANSTVCAGGNTTFSVTASNATSYQWQENTGSGFANIANGGIYSGATTATFTLTGITSAKNGATYRVIINGTLISNAATLTVNVPGTWLGGSSTAWSNTANWSCSILPTSTTDITIPSGTTFSPLVDITTAAANNITIASGATLAFTGTANVLSIYGTLTNTGTFNPASGKTVFAGTTQTIPALTYTNLQMNGGGSKSLAGAITVSGVLSLTNGYIVLGSNNLTITNTGSVTGANINSFLVASGTGGIIQNNVGSGGRTGNITFPVGISTTSYTPVYLNNTSGTADNFKVRVINNVYSSYNASDVPTGTVYTSKVVGRTWFITEGTVGGSNATVTAQWNGADELNGFDNTNCLLSHYYSGGWHSSAAPTNAGGFDPYTVSVAGVTSFSPFGVGSIGSPLPLNLLSFNGHRVSNDVILNWVTANEQDMKEFVVERSKDGIDFVPLNSTGANNSTAQTNTYQFTDKDVSETANIYYRIKMIGINGSHTYSSTISITGKFKADFSLYTVYPNPVSSEVFSVRVAGSTTGSIRIVVRDMSGKQLYETVVPAFKAGMDIISLNVKLPSGIYMMQVSDDIATEQIKIVRQ